jgi:DNA-binding Lrp family transcriptional regulator
MVLDELDRAILRALQADARLSHRALARAVGSTAPTMAARIRRMEELGIIQGYTVRLDPARFGSPPDPAAGAELDVQAPVAVVCHTCDKPTAAPLWLTLEDRRHPFCCVTCRDTFTARYQRLRGNG